MIQKIATQAVYVSDQQKAEDFWTKLVGFEICDKKDMGNGFYWLEVAPKGAETAIVLYPKKLMEDWESKKASIVFLCDDAIMTYQELKQKGVEAVGEEPQKMQWGTFAFFKDPDGNEFVMKSE